MHYFIEMNNQITISWYFLNGNYHNINEQSIKLSFPAKKNIHIHKFNPGALELTTKNIILHQYSIYMV